VSDLIVSFPTSIYDKYDDISPLLQSKTEEMGKQVKEKFSVELNV